MDGSEKRVVGHTECGTCGYGPVPVKIGKNLRPYYCCPECDTQVFTRSRAGEAALMKRTKLVPAPPAPAPAPTPTPTPAPKKEAPKPHGQPAPAPASKPARRGLLDF